MFSSSAARVTRYAATASRFGFRGLLSQQGGVTPQQPLHLVRCFSAFLNPDDVRERVMTAVKNFDKVDPSKVTSASKFADDLGLDSLDAVEVVMAIEDEFAIEIPDAEADKIASIEDAVEFVSAHPMAK
eukprot:CAMPEP_0118717524 /NCGR_PEP_ID=MMETSP0800-20121206/28218_1 /TAXON_ID=210618 ORGANISM="Striatella unipunctata, Strain CCMP2910" /NCGR_SAMPLE_ID=MMETSP0800 /ASSEMBLY_ACC=CAM_ASM_000638 /LENGTH=128 /DNA_ID=CAMNT_0006624293 /DNA_START=60 /DNA_END=446 /DNA_ORIENTATION=+